MNNKFENLLSLMDKENNPATTNRDDNEYNEKVEPVPLNVDFPFEELPSPFIMGPLFSCSEIVRTRGVLRGATVRIFAEGNEIGSAVSIDGSCSIEVSPLLRGERVTAIQEFDGRASSEFKPELIVLPHPQKLTPPVFQIPIYECSNFIAFSGCFVGARLYVTVDGVESGMILIRNERQGFFVPKPLQVGQKIEATITLCEEADDTLKATVAEPVMVKQAPDPVPQARIDEDSITIGNDHVLVKDIFYNALQELNEASRGVSLSYNSFHQSSWFILPSGFLIEAGDQYSIVQSLCTYSAISEVIKVDGNDPRFTQLPAPTVQAPICPGDTIVRIQGCRPGAVVVVLVGSQVITQASADRSEVIIRTPSNRPFAVDELVSAVQYIGNIVSPKSAEVRVAGMNSVSIEIEHNQRHVNDEEQVYNGVLDTDTTALRIHVKTCCDDLDENGEPIRALLTNEYGDDFAPITLVSYGSGFYEGVFFPFPDDMLPAGHYKLAVETPCNNSKGSIKFDVLLTTINRGDTSPPELSLEVTEQSGRSVIVSSNTSMDMTMDVFLGDTLSVVTKASDREGLRTVDVNISSGNIVGLAHFSTRGSPPIPIRKALTVYVDQLTRQGLVIEAMAGNFIPRSLPTRTPKIMVNVKQRIPIITELITPREQAGSTLKIFGNHFFVESENTRVRFWETASGSIEYADPLSNSSDDNLRVNIPRSLNDGNYDVAVLVGRNSLESNTLPLEIYTPEPEPKPEPKPKPKPKPAILRYSIVLSFIGYTSARTPMYSVIVDHFDFGVGMNYWKIRSIDMKAGAFGFLQHDTTGTIIRFGAYQTGISAFNGELSLGRWVAEVLGVTQNAIPTFLVIEIEGEVP